MEQFELISFDFSVRDSNDLSVHVKRNKIMSSFRELVPNRRQWELKLTSTDIELYKFLCGIWSKKRVCNTYNLTLYKLNKILNK